MAGAKAVSEGRIVQGDGVVCSLWQDGDGLGKWGPRKDTGDGRIRSAASHTPIQQLYNMTEENDQLQRPPEA